MFSFISLKLFFKHYFIDHRDDSRIFKIKRKARKAYENSEPAYTIHPAHFGTGYTGMKNILSDTRLGYKYRWIATTKYKDYPREIKSTYHHPNPKKKNKVLWYLFPPSKRNKGWETRVVRCI